MGVRTRQTTGRRRARASHARPLPPAQPSRPTTAGARERRSGGPQDEALYSCGCGMQFHAAVSAGVACPHCGGEQAW